MKKVLVPEGVSGEWRVERFEVPENSSYFHYKSRSPSPGIYTRLMRGNTVVMSDTTAEMSDHYSAVNNAKGHILINGLGIGMVLLNSLLKDSVKKATVIELSSDVIGLVAPHYISMFGDKVEIIHADAMSWKPPPKAAYGMVWHDIWDSICGDNYDEMKTLHRRFGRKSEWQGSWCKYQCMHANK